MMLWHHLGFAAFAAVLTFIALTADDDLEGRVRSVLGGFIGTFAWGMVLFGAFNVEVTTGAADPVSQTYPAIALFAAGMAVLCLVLAFLGPFELVAALDKDTDVREL